jgi:hypothetical protein
MSNLKIQPNYRENAKDALGNEITVGCYVLYNYLDRGTLFKVAFVTGFTKDRVRVCKDNYNILKISIMDENKLVVVSKDLLVNQNLSKYKEIEELLMMPKKLEML